MAGIAVETKVYNLKQTEQAFALLASLNADLSPVLDAIGHYQFRSTARNFEASGRPVGWAPLSDATLRIASGQGFAAVGGRKARAYLHTGRRGLQTWKAPKGSRIEGKQSAARVRRSANSKPLRDTSALLRSVTSAAGTGSIYQLSRTRLRMGTRLIYAAIHQAGGEIRVTPKMRRYLHVMGLHLSRNKQTIKIPARPYLVILPEDEEEYGVIASWWAARNLQRAFGEGRQMLRALGGLR